MVVLNMPIISGDFLTFAEQCCLACNEISYRNSVSRAYYSMYHRALESLISLPSYSSNHHSALIEYLKSSSQNKNEPFEASKMKSLGYRLDQQRRARHEADYDLSGHEVTKGIADAAIAAAKLFFADWESMKQNMAS